MIVGLKILRWDEQINLKLKHHWFCNTTQRLIILVLYCKASELDQNCRLSIDLTVLGVSDFIWVLAYFLNRWINPLSSKKTLIYTTITSAGNFSRYSFQPVILGWLLRRQVPILLEKSWFYPCTSKRFLASIIQLLVEEGNILPNRQ